MLKHVKALALQRSAAARRARLAETSPFLLFQAVQALRARVNVARQRTERGIQGKIGETAEPLSLRNSQYEQQGLNQA